MKKNVENWKQVAHTLIKFPIRFLFIYFDFHRLF